MWRAYLSIYSGLYAVAILLWILATRLGLARRGKQTIFAPRLGLGSALREIPVPEAERIWIHAVSVGEVNAVQPLLQALSQRPGVHIYLSTVTATGRQIALERLGKRATVIPFPLDLAFSCRRFLDHLRPSLILVAETELWPNFVTCAADRKVPVILVNGRISDRSFHRYRRISWFLGRVMCRLSHACVRSRQDKERLLALGLPPDRVNWVGNLKFDCTIDPDPGFEPLRALIRSRLKPSPESLLWVCGSTKPGEEDQLFSVFARLSTEFPDLRLLLAPRHPHRAEEVLAIARRHGIEAHLRSRLADVPQDAPSRAVILDTVGELARLYEMADLVFMGGSLVSQGGQNPIEPAFFGKPILVGPDMSNFRDVAESFREAYALLQVQSAAELEERMRDLIRDPHAREWLGRNARKVIHTNQGAVERTLAVVTGYLAGNP